jgi:DNA-binding NtrC family response regulator
VIAGVTASGPDLSKTVRELFRLDPEMPIILMADDIRLRDAYMLGDQLAYDCVPRVVDNGWLVHKFKLAILQRRLLLENRALSLNVAEPAPSNVPDNGPDHGSDDDLPGALYQSSEKRVILDALTRTRWNRRKAARLLGISYNTLRRRIDQYRLNTTSLSS